MLGNTNEVAVHSNVYLLCAAATFYGFYIYSIIHVWWCLCCNVVTFCVQQEHVKNYWRINNK